VFFREGGKVQIGEDVAQKNLALDPALFQDASGLARSARLCPKVQIGEDQRVVLVQIHAPVVPADCYGSMNTASILVHTVTAG
jgi:hypothetical protein